MFSCFSSTRVTKIDKSKQDGKKRSIVKEPVLANVVVNSRQPRYEYVRARVITNHDSEINCIEPLPFHSYLNVNFATGASYEIKLWNSGRCMHTIPNAHQSQIYAIKSFLTLE